MYTHIGRYQANEARMEAVRIALLFDFELLLL
jgi:hypothetical protein